MEFVASCKSEVLITSYLLWRAINFPLSNIILYILEVVATTIYQTLYLITVKLSTYKGDQIYANNAFIWQYLRALALRTLPIIRIH